MKQHDKIRAQKTLSRTKRMYVLATILILAFLYIVAFVSTPFDIHSSSVSTLETLRRLFIEPLINTDNYDKYSEYIGYMLETIAIAYAGILVATILAVPVGFLAARNVGGRFSYIGKALLNAIRAVLELIFSIIFVAAVGIGPYAGVLGISSNSISMLGKLYAQVIESIDSEKVDAINASGGNKVQSMWYGIVPHVLTEFVTYSVYGFETDVRASTVIDIFGAGGIAAPVILATKLRNWDEVGMILVVVAVLIGLIDILSGAIRKRLIELFS